MQLPKKNSEPCIALLDEQIGGFLLQLNYFQFSIFNFLTDHEKTTTLKWHRRKKLIKYLLITLKTKY